MQVSPKQKLVTTRFEGVVDKVLDSDILVSEFELQSRY